MSCNHSKAIKAFQKAKDIGALHKLLTKIMDQSPAAVSEAWDSVDLAGHKCHICNQGILASQTVKNDIFVCSKCSAFVLKVLK